MRNITSLLLLLAMMGCNNPHSKPATFCIQDGGGMYVTDRPRCEEGEKKVTADEYQAIAELLGGSTRQ